MNKQIVRVIEHIDAAQRARQALLDAGFDPDGIDISPTGDEAGPTAANFTVGDSPAAKGGTDYKDVYAPAPEANSCIITIIADESRLDKAASILADYGAEDKDPAHQH